MSDPKKIDVDATAEDADWPKSMVDYSLQSLDEAIDKQGPDAKVRPMDSTE